MKRSLALRILLVTFAFGVMFTPGSLFAQDVAPLGEAPVLVEVADAPAAPPTIDPARFTPATVAAAVDDERPPLRDRVRDTRVDEQHRRVRRVRVRRALIVTAVLAGVVAASVGVSKLIPEPRTTEQRERDSQDLVGLLLLLGAV